METMETIKRKNKPNEFTTFRNIYAQVLMTPIPKEKRTKKGKKRKYNNK